jgi:hypothetical protein
VGALCTVEERAWIGVGVPLSGVPVPGGNAEHSVGRRGHTLGSGRAAQADDGGSDAAPLIGEGSVGHKDGRGR